MASRLRFVWLTTLLLTLVALTGAARAIAEQEHEVARGQSLWGIARRYKVTVEALRRHNGLEPSESLHPGQTLRIPTGKAKAPRAGRRGRTAQADRGAAPCKTHVVGQGQSLWKIARRYNVSVDAILQQNGLQESDPIKPGQTLDIPPRTGTCGRARSSGPSAASEPPAVAPASTRTVAPPPGWTQTQKTAAERGVNPCMTPDSGWGVYDPWSRAPSMGQMIAPQRGGIAGSGAFDVMFHFHGHEPVRKEWVKVMDGAVLVGIDLGIGSGPYDQAFANPATFEGLVHSVERAMAEKTGNKRAHVRKVGLSAWSAGYGAVGRILSQSYGKRNVDTVVLLDGLHCGYQGRSLDETQLGPFIEFAKRAAGGQKLMFISHSSIIPPGYASTTETANFLLHKLGSRPRRVRPRGGDPMGLELISRFSRGGLHVRGYKGNDKMDHCAHIGLFRDILKVHVKRRWHSPRGRAR